MCIDLYVSVAGSRETGNESLMKSFVLHLFCEQGLLPVGAARPVSRGVGP